MSSTLLSSQSPNQAAWLKSITARPLAVEPAPTPTPGPNELLVRNHAVAANPLDVKQQRVEFMGKMIKNYPAVLGVDGSGVVVAVGADVVGFAPGDRVMTVYEGFGAQDARKGGFQHLALANPTLTAKIPTSLSYAEAAALPLALSTAAAGLYQKTSLGLAPPEPDTAPGSAGKTLLVWGGASGVGMAAVQLAVASGLEVAATAGAHNHELVRGLGAAHVFDHAAPDVVDRIVAALAATGKDFAGVYDAIATEQTTRAGAAVADRLGGNKFVVRTQSHVPVDGLPDGVRTGGLFATTIANDDVGPAVWGRYVGQALEKGVLKAKPEPLVVGQGLESVQVALDRLAEGVSARKVVVELP